MKVPDIAIPQPKKGKSVKMGGVEYPNNVYPFIRVVVATDKNIAGKLLSINKQLGLVKKDEIFGKAIWAGVSESWKILGNTKNVVYANFPQPIANVRARDGIENLFKILDKMKIKGFYFGAFNSEMFSNLED